jgi:predicted TIM-barrel fold metal-dependent hydrolase
MTDLSTTDAPLCLPPRPLGRLPVRRLAPGATDCHFHVFRPGAPLAPQRSYTPSIVQLDAWLELARVVGISRGVLVQPSVYGFDNTVLLEALQAAPDQLRGIVVLPPEVAIRELERLHGLGVRGVRCNTRNPGGLGFDAVGTLAPKIAALGWTLQFQARPEQLAALVSLVPALGLSVVIDHLGFVDPRETDNAVRQLQALLDTGSCYAKISAPYRLRRDTSYRDFGTVTAALARSHPERLIWGSDWPHTELRDAMPDDADLIDRAADWLGDEATRQLVFVDTPRSLFFDH